MRSRSTPSAGSRSRPAATRRPRSCARSTRTRSRSPARSTRRPARAPARSIPRTTRCGSSRARAARTTCACCSSRPRRRRRTRRRRSDAAARGMTDGGWSVVRELKRDALGRVELLAGPSGPCVRRVACGNGWPGTRWVGRLLLRRERAALRALADCPQVPRLLDLPGGAPIGGPISGAGRRDTLLRSWCAGEPLWSVAALPADFFAALRALVLELHARGVCHNDLHKENNILVGEDGRPWLIDFQLDSVSRRRRRTF